MPKKKPSSQHSDAQLLAEWKAEAERLMPDVSEGMPRLTKAQLAARDEWLRSYQEYEADCIAADALKGKAREEAFKVCRIRHVRLMESMPNKPPEQSREQAELVDSKVSLQVAILFSRADRAQRSAAQHWVDEGCVGPVPSPIRDPLLVEKAANVVYWQGQATPSGANTTVIFKGTEPTPDVKDLAFRLASRGNKSEADVAREFVGNGNDSKAKSLLSQVRRLKRTGRITFASS